MRALPPIALALFAAALTCTLPAQSSGEGPILTAPEATASPPAPSAAAELSIRDAVVLGLVEGITEFLPISSTGHLIIANRALDLEAEEPLRNEKGQLLWYKKPTEKTAGEPLTLKLAADTFAVVIQVGAIAAVVLIYWNQLIDMLRGVAGLSAAGLRLLRNVLLAFLPCAIAGYCLHDWIDHNLFSVKAVVIALISGAILMVGAERWRTRRSGAGSSRLDPADLAPRHAFGIGLMQCLALWPGTSRSMVTIVGGYFCGLSPAKAAEFSFLVGLPTLAGAAVLKGVKSGPAMIAVFGWEHVVLGTAVAGISAAIAVKFLVNYLTRHGLVVFAIYRVILALTLVIWAWN